MTEYICTACISGKKDPCTIDVGHSSTPNCCPYGDDVISTNWRKVEPAEPDEPIPYPEVAEVHLPNGYTITVTPGVMAGNIKFVPGDEPRPVWKQNSLYIPPGSSDTVQMRGDGSVFIRDFRCPGCKEKDAETSKWRGKVMYLEGKTRGQNTLIKKLTDLIDEGDAEIERLKTQIAELEKQQEADTETAGILADVVDILFEEGDRCERLGYTNVKARAVAVIKRNHDLRKGFEDLDRENGVLRAERDALNDAIKSECAKNAGMVDNIAAIKKTLDKLAKKKK